MRLPGIDPGWIAGIQASLPAIIAHSRVWLGWGSIGLGVLGTILPIIPGLPFLIIGTHMIGHRDRRLRWARVQLKLLLRTLSHSRLPPVRHSARRARQVQAQTIRTIRAWRRKTSGKRSPQAPPEI